MPGETLRNRAQKTPKIVSNSFAAFTPILPLPHFHFVLAVANLRIPEPLLILFMVVSDIDDREFVIIHILTPAIF